MSRIYNPNAVGKRRKMLLRMLALALREWMAQTGAGQTARDLVAFLVLTLEEVAATVRETTAAWEKRGYWVKADRFRLEWEWTETLAARLRQALLAEDWDEISRATTTLFAHLRKVDLPRRHRLGRPWEGAWVRFLARERERADGG